MRDLHRACNSGRDPDVVALLITNHSPGAGLTLLASTVEVMSGSSSLTDAPRSTRRAMGMPAPSATTDPLPDVVVVSAEQLDSFLERFAIDTRCDP